MEIRIEGMESLQRWLDERLHRIQDMDRLKSDIAVVLDVSMRKNFENESAPDGTPWKELADSTLEYRSSRNLDTKKLYNYGALWQTMDTQITGYGVKSGSVNGSVPYARIHQMGGKAGRGRNVTIPARPYIGLNPALIQKIKRVIEDNT